MLMAFSAGAQNENGGAQMADVLRENGKIYVVITVIGIIFIALVFFLVYLERKLKRLEDEIRNK
ncbi:MAG: CcmD family protein [Bacteroidia bacterium]|nr:CcmD family protein [Bacteroidia bacterium]